MRKILITGATGNIGLEVINHLYPLAGNLDVCAGVRDTERANIRFKMLPALKVTAFDFENPDTYASAFQEVECVFLLRPPHISDVKGVFHPLISAMEKTGVKQVVFLSVQGVEKSKAIPHHKIEKILRGSSLEWISLRPGYFMQNLTTTLRGDIQRFDSIVLPAGKAPFNWVDAKDIGAVSAQAILKFESYKYKNIEITGTENLSFYEVAAKMSEILNRPIKFRSVNLLKFFMHRRRQGMHPGMILVMSMLHYLPRFQKEPNISNACEEITGKKPTSLSEFIKREQALFTSLDV